MARRRRLNTTQALFIGITLACLATPSCAVEPADSNGTGATTGPRPGREGWRRFTVDNGLPDDFIRAVHVAADQVWVGTDGGLALRSDGTWKRWTQEDGLPWPAIQAIDVDEQTQEVWLGTWGGGLVRFSGGRFDQFDQRNSGLAGDLVFDVLVEGGRVWAATNAGLSAFDPIADTWDTHFPRSADARQQVVTALCRDPAGAARFYAAEWCGRLWERGVSRDVWTQVHAPPALLTEASGEGAAVLGATLCIESGGETLWWLTTRGLMRRGTSGRWEVSGLEMKPARSSIIHCLAAANSERVWLGTDQGLQVLTDWKTGALSACPAPGGGIRCIAFQGDRAWVGTTKGLIMGPRQAPAGGFPPTLTTLANDPRPRHLTEVPIAVIGPMKKLVGLPGEHAPGAVRRIYADRLAVQLAIRLANERGGYRGEIPFTLATSPKGYDRYGWGTPEDDYHMYAYDDEVLGLVARFTPDCQTDSAVALHTEVPVVNAARSPAALPEEINPWVFRCRSYDARYHELLLDYVVDELGRTRIAILRTAGGPAQWHLDQWSRHARRRGLAPVADLFLNPKARHLAPQLRALKQAKPDVVLTWSGAQLSAEILRLLRDEGLSSLFVGCGEIVCDSFTDAAGEEPGRVIAAYPCNHDSAEAVAEEFAKQPAKRPSAMRKPRLPVEAHSSFDAASHLLEAINIAGLDRRAIRRTLRDMDEAALARLVDGRWETFTRFDSRR